MFAWSDLSPMFIEIKQPVLHDFLNRGLVISPWLMMNSHDRFDASLFLLIDGLANQMVETYWTENLKILFYQDLPIVDRIPRTAVYEIIASTAMSIAHYRKGDMEVVDEYVMHADEILKTFISDYGFGSIMNLYWLVTSFENMQALHYYQQIPERIFSMGTWHRPWVDYSLSDELLSGVFFDNYQIELINDKRYVSLTERGQETYKEMTKFLEDSGYLTHRVRQLQIHNFTLNQNYAELADEFWPNMMLLRQDFMKWITINPGMRVLELGCGDGVSTFESGLVDLVGENGRVDAIDPSMGMIHRANIRKKQHGANWVYFHQAQAENLPFDNESFDVVIAFLSLQFMDLPKALSEVTRVLKPKGIFGSFHPVKFNMLDNPVLKDWYTPVVNIAKVHGNENPRDVLKTSEKIVNDFVTSGFAEIEETIVYGIWYFGDAEMVAHMTFRGIGWMQEELSMIPWQAREDVISEVIVQGKALCKKYSDEERLVKFPDQMIKGRKN